MAVAHVLIYDIYVYNNKYIYIYIYICILIEAVPCSATVSRKVFLLNRVPSSFHGPIQMLKRLGPPSDVKRCSGKKKQNIQP